MPAGMRLPHHILGVLHMLLHSDQLSSPATACNERRAHLHRSGLSRAHKPPFAGQHQLRTRLSIAVTSKCHHFRLQPRCSTRAYKYACGCAVSAHVRTCACVRAYVRMCTCAALKAKLPIVKIISTIGAKRDSSAAEHLALQRQLGHETVAGKHTTWQTYFINPSASKKMHG